jgi:hypothetical protein
VSGAHVAKSGPKPDAVIPHDLKAAARRALPIVGDAPTHAVTARFPDDVALLDDDERARRVRAGADSILLDDKDGIGRKTTRGFVRVAMRVPVGDPRGQLYGVFVEVDKSAYRALQDAFRSKSEVRVWGTLANRLPLLEGAFGSRVEIVEDGSDLRARVVAADHALLVRGPVVGPRET